MLKSYWEQPEATAERSATAGSTPATAGIIDDENYVTIHDRKKDVIISGGENVSSIEVEDALFSHPAVAEVAVIGVPDESGARRSRRWSCSLPDERRSTEAELHRRTAASAWPTTSARPPIEFRDELARTATGKLQKFKLREPYWEGATARSTELGHAATSRSALVDAGRRGTGRTALV